jgi:N-acetyl-gamma-glutamyl-phosphate reductase
MNYKFQFRDGLEMKINLEWVLSTSKLKAVFVKLLPEGQMPKTAAVLGSNFAQMQIAIDEHSNRVVVSIAIDNLGKGAAAQALHNANLMSGYSESAGLIFDGLGV